MKTKKFRDIQIGEIFYKIGDYAKIDMYEKTSDSYGLEILTNSSQWFNDEDVIYVD